MVQIVSFNTKAALEHMSTAVLVEIFQQQAKVGVAASTLPSARIKHHFLESRKFPTRINESTIFQTGVFLLFHN